MKIGLDIHGVLTSNPRFFSVLSQLAVSQGHELHILTGSMLTNTKIEELSDYGAVWTHLFSISDYHRHLGTPITFSDPNNPWIEEGLWNKTKAEYCYKHSIDFHIDDTQKYGEFFKTPFALYDLENNRIDWHYLSKKTGAICLETPEEVLTIIEKISLDIDSLKN